MHAYTEMNAKHTETYKQIYHNQYNSIKSKFFIYFKSYNMYVHKLKACSW